MPRPLRRPSSLCTPCATFLPFLLYISRICPPGVHSAIETRVRLPFCEKMEVLVYCAVSDLRPGVIGTSRGRGMQTNNRHILFLLRSVTRIYSHRSESPFIPGLIGDIVPKQGGTSPLPRFIWTCVHSNCTLMWKKTSEPRRNDTHLNPGLV